MTRRSAHILLGAAVLTLLLAMIVVSYQGSAKSTASGYPLIARYTSADGVSVGTAVLLAGIRIGEVSRIDYEPASHRAALTLTVAHGVELPIDSVAKIVSRGLLGDKYIKVDPGGDFDMLAPGDEFEYVQGSIDLEELLKKVVENAEARRAQAPSAEQRGPDVDASVVDTPSPQQSPFGSLLNP